MSTEQQRQDRLDQWRRDLDAYKREINLVEYAISCGYELRKKESYRSAKVLKHAGDNHKIVVARDATDNHWVYFAIQPGNEAVKGRGFARGADNGTIVDFILCRNPRADMKRVHEACRRWLGRPDPLPPRPEHDVLPSQPTERDRLTVAMRYEAAQAPAGHAYLEERGLSPRTLQDPRFRASWRQDARGNALFVHRDAQGICGYEVKNRSFTGFSSGGVKGLWCSTVLPGDKRLVVAESAIDAMSYDQLHIWPPDTRYLSIGGTPHDGQLALLKRAAEKMPAGSTVIAAVDADRGGDLLHDALKRCMAQPHVRFVRHSPAVDRCKDWNDVLQQQTRAREPGLGR